ncbi:MAG: aquaporin [Pirellulales bacterium]|jgi:aquaporin Z|nr:aquaporin [Pirellulales bacterium]
MLRRISAEIFGTFCLLFAGTGAIVINDTSGGSITHVGVALVFGLVVMAMVHAVGDISGAHLNPAVTLGMWVAKRLPMTMVLPYVLAQLVGGFAASLLLRLLFPAHPTLGATIPAGSAWQSFILEVALTWILMVVVLRVSSGPKERGMFAGITVGSVIAVEALFAGPICGASMNPVRSITPAVTAGVMDDLWIYIAAPLLGSLLAVATAPLLRDDMPGEDS